MNQETTIPDCCICGESCRNDKTGWHQGHNPAPLKSEGRCCDVCNALVIACRMNKYLSSKLLG